MDSILDSNGLFWWGHEEIPEGLIAPPSSVAGRLTIDGSGVSRLDLVGLLTPVVEAQVALFRQGQPLDQSLTIFGTLSAGKGTVVLGRLRRNGSTMASMGLSVEGFIALDCLLDKNTMRPVGGKRFHSLTVDVSNLGEWFYKDAIHLTPRRGAYRLDVKAPPEVTYKLEGKHITVFHRASPSHEGAYPRSYRSLEIKQYTYLKVRSVKTLSLEEHREEMQLIEDLFILLTGHRVYVPWPSLRGRGKVCTYYYGRTSEIVEPVRLMECWTSWGMVQQSFGNLYDGLRRGIDDWGPGLYLYLGTRRATKLFTENRFMNLVWGLESLHRKTQANKTPDTTRLSAKIERILAQIEQPKDKKWLANKLKNAGEPSLEERLFELFEELPLEVDRDALRAFSKQCADRRNDISHFGGDRHGSYSEFSTRLNVLTRLVIDLYHALLLQRIGLDPSVVKRRFYGGPNSYGYGRLFHELGLTSSMEKRGGGRRPDGRKT
ncbi:hypothetical protein IAG25_32655 [Caballeronia sp. EK]|uniref:ApeA N-terminal domain 1-containing protein n=1 Tax=Caballeronia sp. EK TaxID=2767469 RepID=UPI001654E6E3|nr:HEPN domain-containing protein [Caballeronia sp. EK]MBC8641576.1 hypothetical protein [Caballeronia sp. EK]